MDSVLLSKETEFFLTNTLYTDKDIIEAIPRLRAVIVEHNKRYYIDAAPVIADIEYDQLFLLLQEWEQQYPELISDDSPTRRLVWQLVEWFKETEHFALMQSLQNTYNADDIVKRHESLERIVHKWWEKCEWTYVIEPKIDGMSVELVYEKGKLVRWVTRWDGKKGEDITEHVKLLIDLPHYIHALKTVDYIAFRGEIVQPKEAFDRLVIEEKTTSWSTFANARNATAWTLRQLDTSLVRKRGLTCFVYDILYSSQSIDLLFNTNSHVIQTADLFWLFQQRWLPCLWLMWVDKGIDEVVAFCLDSTTKNQINQMSVVLDGLVVKVSQLLFREQFGSTHHHPRWAIAYKFPAEQISTKLLDVTYQVGRTWVLTPVAELFPVQLSGVVVKRATLHNRSYIIDLDLHRGDRVLIQRSGEVIPYIVSVLSDRRDGTEQPIDCPTHCPVCYHKVYLDEEAGTLWCTNLSCSAQLKQRLEHFVSKSCVDIEWLWPRLIEMSVDAWLLSTVYDIFLLLDNEKKARLRSLPWVAEKKIVQLCREIESKKNTVLWRILAWMSIRHVGVVIAQLLTRHYFAQVVVDKRSIESMRDFFMHQEAIAGIHWIWPQIVTSLQHYFSDVTNINLFRQLDHRGLIDWDDKVWKQDYNQDQKLTTLSLVITGTLPYPRERIEQYFNDLWANIQQSVTKKTTYLIVGDNPWSKVTKAEELAVPTLSFFEFIHLYGIDVSILATYTHSKGDATLTQEALQPALFS